MGRNVKIAVIGWGSLIWDPRKLDIEPEWHPDGPMLPVEFARFSGRDRLTLVLVEGAPAQRTLWTLSKKVTLAAAAGDLRAREETSQHNIGSWSCADGLQSQSSVVAAIARWAQGVELNGVVWTALGPNTPERENGLVSEEQRIAYLKKLVAARKDAAAREYFQRAPTQIATPLRARIRDQLGWS